MRELPRGWAWASLPELIGSDGIFTDGDWVETKDQDPAGDVRLTQLADVGEGAFRDRSNRFLTSDAAARLGCTYVKAGDVLVARMPDPLGRACIFPGDRRLAITAVDVCIVRPGGGGVESRWLMWWMNTPQFRADVLARQAGTTRKRISRKNLGDIRFPLSPLPEQRRIVAAIEEHLSRLEAAAEDLRTVRVRLHGLRRSLLRRAFVVADEHCELGELAEVVAGQTPRGLSSRDGGSIAFYKVGDMNTAVGGEMAAARTWLDIEAIAAHRLKLWPAGTVIFPKQGGAIATNKKRVLGQSAACDLNTMGVVPGPLLRSRFLRLWLETIDLASLSDGSVVAQIKRPTVERLRIPKCRLEEQDRITETVQRELAAVDAVGVAGEKAWQRSRALRSAILTRAFRGELVPQDPSDEPASVILDRIATQRTLAPKLPKKRKAKTSA